MNQENKIRPTSGPWRVEGHNGNQEPFVVCDCLIATVHHECVKPQDELDANARLIAAAGTSASACYALGLDGTKCVENVGEIVTTLERLLVSWDKFAPANVVTVSGEPTNAESARDLLSKLKN